ncbi:hypothetical protein Chor_008235 [Crotalus horridus]
MDVAVPHTTGLNPAPEVEDCTCPPGYRGPSCQDCDVGYTRTTSGLYLGTCEPCSCNRHATECDTETGECQVGAGGEATASSASRAASIILKGSIVNAANLDSMGTPATGRPGTASRAHATGHLQPSSRQTWTCFVDADGGPTCDSCAPGYIGRQCER